MLFNSLSFLIFFPVTLLLYFILPVRFKNFSLLILSYVFYMGWNSKYALLLLFCTAVTYGASLLINRIEFDNKKRVFVLILALVVVLSILFYFKYLNFILELIKSFVAANGFESSIPHFDIILPVGISFFTFQSIGYLIDVYRGDVEVEKNFFTYALFVSFFPQLVAGPIERSHNLLKQLKVVHDFEFYNLKSGLITMCWGYFMKMVVADRASILVDFVFNNKNSTGIQVMFAVFVFAFQIYCDFCGYSTIAVGASRILGIKLMQNFDAPYLASGFQDFWRRWHISLSSWFKDYIYIPLGGNRKGTVRKYLNIIIVMFISGIWHGAGINYIFWGLLNGVLQVADSVIKPVKKHVNKIILILFNFALVCFTWLFFRAKSMTHAVSLIKKILFDLHPCSLKGDFKKIYGIGGIEISVMLLTIILLVTVDIIRCKKISVRSVVLSKHWTVQALCFVLFVLFILVFGVWGGNYNPASFIYFQF